MLFHKTVKKVYKGYFFKRADDVGTEKYFSHEDFVGLRAKSYGFISSKGHKLQGWFYFYDDYDTSRLIIWDHGIGGGHRSYMKEIEMLCANGFLVFAYDHTGCMDSEGENTGGLTQSLCDLNDCIKALKADADVNTDDISVMGHSWGGYATLNIVAFHPDIKRIVSLSGFISARAMHDQVLTDVARLYKKDIYKLEASSNPQYVDCNAIDALRNSNVKALIIHSEDDTIVDFQVHFGTIKRELEGKEGIELLPVRGKGHNPTYTAEACKLLGELYAELKKQKPTTDDEKKKFRASFDWDKMTEQDTELWDKIISFLKK